MTTPAAPSSAPSTTTSTPSASPSPSASSSPSPSSSSPSPSSSSPAPASGSAPTAQGAQGDVPAAAGTSAEVKEQIRKLKLKVNGKEVEMDEPEVLRRAQLAEAADQKFQEAAKTRKQMEEFVRQLKSDPLSILTNPELGIDFKGLAEQYLGQELQRELMTPEQRELEELREFRRAQEEAAEQARQQEMTASQQREFQALQQRAAKEYDEKITEVLQQSNLPKTPRTVKRVAEMLYNAMEKGYELDINTAVDMVRGDFSTDLTELVGGLDGEGIVKFFGEDVVKKLRKHDLAQLRKLQEAAQSAAPQSPAQTFARQVRDEGVEKMKPDEWKEHLRKKAGL